MDGLPRDVILKPYFYAVKEEVVQRDRALHHLSFQGPIAYPDFH